MAEGTSYWDCFRGVDLRRTEIAAAAWMIQNLIHGLLDLLPGASRSSCYPGL
ncbi:hypothetical protein AYX13_07134 [Cryptococcus neoformans]|nr:hypothetical protein AYX13_07134 [Cryptococcus neoformans var. grubii]